MSDSLRPHGLQQVRLPCPSLPPGICSNSCPLSQWCHPITPCSVILLPWIFPSNRVFSNKSALHIWWPKYWSFNFSISPSNEYSGWISFRTDRFDLLVVQGTLKSLLQHHKLKPSILQHSLVASKPHSTQIQWCPSSQPAARVGSDGLRFGAGNHTLCDRWSMETMGSLFIVITQVVGLYRGQVYPALTCTSDSVIIVSCRFSCRWRGMCADSFWPALGNRVTLSHSSFVDEETVGSSSCPI